MELALTILGAVACMGAMAAMMLAPRVLPRLLRRNERVQRWVERVLARIRAQSTLDRLLTLVEEERPDLRSATAPDGTVTLLFSDIEGSTALNERLGDQRWLQVLGAHNALVRAEIRKHGGYEVKVQGDGFMVAFPSARRAVAAAIAIQRAIEDYGHGPGQRAISVRIGLHCGEAIQREGDFFGRSVAVAARIAGQANGGEILVSALVKELVEDGGDIEFESLREAQLKGLERTHRLFPVRWRREAEVLELDRASA
jgi:class 3 adenylate cyclase